MSIRYCSRGYEPKHGGETSFRVLVTSALVVNASSEKNAVNEARRLIECSRMGFGRIMGQLSENLKVDKLKAQAVGRRAPTGARRRRGPKYSY